MPGRLQKLAGSLGLMRMQEGLSLGSVDVWPKAYRGGVGKNHLPRIINPPECKLFPRIWWLPDIVL